MNPKESRHLRAWGLCAMILAAGFGLASRTPVMSSWPVIGTYGGDAAWTLAACGGFRLLFPRRGSVTIAGLGLLASFGVELSQLIPMRWLQDLRGTTLGALLLGRGFLWSDLIAYAAGAVLAMAIDLPMVRRIRHRPC